MSSSLPYMQFYPADYLADTMHLTTVEHGAYLLLLFNYWQTGQALPVKRLHVLARMTSQEWGEIRETIAELFEERDGAWHHARVERDLKQVCAAQCQRSDAGRKSGQVRRMRSDKKEKNERDTNGRSNETRTGVRTKHERTDERNANETATNRIEQNRIEQSRAAEYIPDSAAAAADLPEGIGSPPLEEPIREPNGKQVVAPGLSDWLITHPRAWVKDCRDDWDALLRRAWAEGRQEGLDILDEVYREQCKGKPKGPIFLEQITSNIRFT